VLQFWGENDFIRESETKVKFCHHTEGTQEANERTSTRQRQRRQNKTIKKGHNVPFPTGQKGG